VNGESNEDRTDGRTNNERDERDRSNERERMAELGRRSGAARRLRKQLREAGGRGAPGNGGGRVALSSPGSGPEQISGELSDREQALAALRRSLDSGNAAAVVAAGKALIDIDKTDPWSSTVSVEDARAQLIAKLDEIEARRRAHGETCPTCSGAGYVGVARPPPAPSVEKKEVSPRAAPVVDGPQGKLRDDIRSLDPGRFFGRPEVDERG
jgi:hypothetical protein